ncbi:MAG: transporter associated domain-containing protein [Acidiferrobacteraceae bacterium]|jgi:magnesium and cobalt transporter
MNSKTDEHPSRRDGENGAPSRSLLDRLSQAFLREPSTRRELIDILREAQEHDLLKRDALDMIEGVLQVSEMQVRDIMIPRAQMAVVDKNQSPEEYLPLVVEEAHSRYPMVDGDKDKVVGILLAKDLLQYFMNKEAGTSFSLDDMLRPAVFIPESKRLDVLLRDFRSTRNHMAIVVDEYGGVSGLVTIEDVLEQIVGEIEDEHDIDEDEIMITPRGDGRYVVKALIPLDEFNEHFGTHFQSDEVDTLGGVLITHLEHVPRRGEKAVLDDLEFRVLRADSRRVHLLEVSRVDQATAAESSE